jgi:hypothetical protein
MATTADLTATALRHGPSLPRLCSFCNSFLYRLRKSLDITPWTLNGIGPILPVPSNNKSYCDFCVQVLRAAKRTSGHRWETDRPKYIRLKEDSSSIGFDDSGLSIFKNSSSESVDPISPPWSKILDELEQCDHHDHSSKLSTSKEDRLRELKIRFIDGEQACVVQIPFDTNIKYVALSYVWRRQDDDPKRQPRLLAETVGVLEQPGALNEPDQCAQTIKDAMEICRKLGLKYLWVDALCVVQDSEYKSLHMKNMDAIYAAAYFTIIPADTESADHGIHGVSLRRGRLQSDFVDPSLFRFGISSMRNWLDKSAWAARGWTYQEATLSRRLLVFTEELCCLICSNGIWREDGYEEPPQDLNKTEPLILLQNEPIFEDSLLKSNQITDWDLVLDKYHSWVSQQLYRHRRFGEGGLKYSPFKQYGIILSSYLKKSLTKSEDILNAFTGICAELQLRMGPFVKGLP